MAPTIYKAHKTRRETLVKDEEIGGETRKSWKYLQWNCIVHIFFSLLFHPFGTWSSSFYYTCECVEQPAIQWITV